MGCHFSGYAVAALQPTDVIATSIIGSPLISQSVIWSTRGVLLFIE